MSTFWPREQPEERRFRPVVFVWAMVVLSVVASFAFLFGFGAPTPGSAWWQYVTGFGVVFAIGMISPPLWLVAYVVERMVNIHQRKTT